MKKFKVEISFLLLVLICVICQKFTLLINYILALMLHELAHIFVATKRGYTLKEFKLSLFGVAVEINEKIDEKDSFAINVSGPFFNLFLCLICVALYWLIPVSFSILNTFCISNLTLAIFNLIPIYPLDGGKIFNTILGAKKYKIFEKFISLGCGILFAIIFIFSILNKTKWIFLLLAIFFFTIKKNKGNEMSLFKYSKNKKIEKVEILKLTGNETLFELLKKIQTRRYTIFYINQTTPKYIDEDEIVELSTKFPLSSTINLICNH